MKKIIMISCVSLFVLSFTSCKKCLKCTYPSDNEIIEYPEECGSSEDRDALEQECLDKAIATASTVNGHCSCTDQ